MDRQSVQLGNKTWWTDHTMSYDWNDRSRVERLTATWYDDIDRRFLGAARLFSDATNPFEALMGADRLVGKRVLEIGCGWAFILRCWRGRARRSRPSIFHPLPSSHEEEIPSLRDCRAISGKWMLKRWNFLLAASILFGRGVLFIILSDRAHHARHSQRARTGRRGAHHGL